MKNELIEAVQKSCSADNISKRLTEDMLDATFQSIQKSIKKNKRFSYPGFGTFLIRNRKARKGRNPQTGSEIQIKASKTIGFRPSPKLKSSLTWFLSFGWHKYALINFFWTIIQSVKLFPRAVFLLIS